MGTVESAPTATFSGTLTPSLNSDAAVHLAWRFCNSTGYGGCGMRLSSSCRKAITVQTSDVGLFTTSWPTQFYCDSGYTPSVFRVCDSASTG